jgi:hypothetical protein
VDVEGGEEYGGAVALVLELASGRETRDGWLGGIDAGLGLHARLLVDAPDQGVFRRIEVEAAHVAGLLPKIGVMARHPRLDLPGLEVEGRTDPPALRGRDGHAVRRHLLGQGLHRPARRAARRCFSHQLGQQENVIMVIDARPAAALAVVEPGQSVVAVASTPQANLVVMQVDDLTDLTVGAALSGQQHDARSLRRPCFHRARTSPRLENRAVTPTQFQWR